MQFDQLKRREFITLLGSAATAWPLAARAQQPGAMRRIGALLGGVETDNESRARATALREGLEKLGWIEGRNLHIDYRWTGGGLDRFRPLAEELVRLNPDVMFAGATLALHRFLKWWHRRRWLNGTEMARIDKMSGLEFERVCGEIFQRLGYKVTVTKASGDQGADLLLERQGRRIVVQTKRQTS